MESRVLNDTLPESGDPGVPGLVFIHQQTLLNGLICAHAGHWVCTQENLTLLTLQELTGALPWHS